MNFIELFEIVINEKRRVDWIEKENVWDSLMKYKYVKGNYDIYDIYISFTSINKLGINPHSEYNTPLGIYSYPLDMFINKLEHSEFEPMSRVFPFAGNAKNVQIFTPKNTNKVIFDLYEYNSKNFDNDIKKLKNAGYDEGQINNLSLHTHNIKVRNPGGIMWYITMMLAKKNPAKWNYILSKVLGYDGIVDRTGQGIIHPSEPVQAVFFNKKGIKHIEEIENKMKSKNIDKRIMSDLTKQGIFNIKKFKESDLSHWFIVGVNGNIKVKDVMIEIKNTQLFWEKGTWYDGIWESGLWENGIWEDGTWYSGIWWNGIWKDGNWNDGEIYSSKYKRLIQSSVNPKEFYQLEKEINSLEELKEKVK